MEPRSADNLNNRDKNRRPIRAKRCNRRTFGEDRRPVKRLFTPEIKRFLKDWLVRRRDNPYPNRDEKKTLSIQTGLTYIQVCNWFANWRRKLKNAGKEPQKKTWGTLIKSYNSQAHGNVEHFSICSDDSIWEEVDNGDLQREVMDHSYISLQKEAHPEAFANNNNDDDLDEEEMHQVSSTTATSDSMDQLNSLSLSGGNKYKNHIMEKYLRDCQNPQQQVEDPEEDKKPPILSKWLESAAKFRPSHNNYLNWTFERKTNVKNNATNNHNKKQIVMSRGREELDAAEALTRLANIHTV